MATAVIDSSDKRLAGLIVKAGLASKDHVHECLKIRAKLAAAGAASKSLAEVLAEKGYVTGDGAAEIGRLAEKVKAAEKKADEDGAAAAGAPAGKLKIPGYEILELLGKGGMGAVYKARQKSLDRVVALKVLSPEVARDETYLKRFTTEARALARLNHENIIAGIDVGEANGYRYFAMEFVEGESLAALIERDGALPEKRALTIAMQVARALVHADKNSLVHRDIKPQNIMIGRNDVAKLCDLGLAMTAEERKEARERGQSIGTPHYISPEQARGEHHVDIRSDIYSLGATLYHAVTGETPFGGTSPMVLMTKHLTEDPVPPRKRNPRLSRPLNDLILKMMAKEKDKRYQTSIELLEDMERVLAGRPIDSGGARAARGGGAERAQPAAHKAQKLKTGSGARVLKHGKGATGARRSPRPDDEEPDGEEYEEEEERPRHRKKAPSPAVPGLIALAILIVVGGLAYAIWSANANKPAVGPPPPSAQFEQNAMDSLTNIRSAYNHDKDKHAAIRLLTQLLDTFPRTKAAALAAEDIHKLEQAPFVPQAESEVAAEGEPEPALKRAPLGSKEVNPDEERAARDRADAERAGRAPE